jgi:hypothetical protein
MRRPINRTPPPGIDQRLRLAGEEVEAIGVKSSWERAAPVVNGAGQRRDVGSILWLGLIVAASRDLGCSQVTVKAPAVETSRAARVLPSTSVSTHYASHALGGFHPAAR